ncbi:cyclase [Candidatus Methanoperedens nitratireducens]|uniref:Cyclase/dehydrase n=1 Tax=Candidatus Methanoperedens nitratireducens TaxID=1392998 RepID=A0A284VSW0_9EURY|nr:cyclase [Candidatus Methanoperedens nitroreducens]SNQ62374.1 Cyclase/dehydrase [Candidatus Methanoperedens nitroreducens]
MVYLLAIGKVKDYSKWKPMFDEFANSRKEYGSKGGRLFRIADKPNELAILYEWESIEKARKFAQSEDLKKYFERAGVIGKPEFYYLEEVEQLSA